MTSWIIKKRGQQHEKKEKGVQGIKVRDQRIMRYKSQCAGVQGSKVTSHII